MLTFDHFSTMNRERSESPQGFGHTLSDWSLSDWMTATMGELGEAANVAKKMNRLRDQTGGVREDERDMDDLVAKLMMELADTAIYLDLTATVVAMTHGIKVEGPENCSPLADAIRHKFNVTSERIGSPYRMEENEGLKDAAKQGYSAGFEAAKALFQSSSRSQALLDVLAERARQIGKGYTPERDASRYFNDRGRAGLEMRMTAASLLADLDADRELGATGKLPQWGIELGQKLFDGKDFRQSVVVAAAMAIAIVEAMDESEAQERREHDTGEIRQST